VSDRDARRAPRGLERLPGTYEVPAGHFDELIDPASGALRPAWQAFSHEAARLDERLLADAQRRIDRQLHENGVTYNVYASADGPARPWAVDALPLVIDGDEWQQLAGGLRQRARLLEWLVADLYGPQRVLAEALLPPALLFAHPGFLRACHGVTPPGGRWLHQVAFDLARGSDGAWQVIGTRAQSPSGSGYALENRIAISRAFPGAFHRLRVHRLGPFFARVQEQLATLSAADGDDPHIVLLTPGPYNETYFEHSYLARHLGFTLAEGGDLVVRHDRVYLKTVTGLRRVHAILRRLDDGFCDPVELRSDSTLGVPGLVQAWRAGGVVVANALGTGVLESPALLGFLPAIAEAWSGEPLRLPSVATWWCGEAAAFDDARAHLDGLVLKQALPDRAMEPLFFGDLATAERDAWIARVSASPESYVFQRYLPLAHVPAWDGGRFEGRAFMLRAYLVADGQGDYEVLPGGLTRVAGADRHVVSSQRGGSSKDTWVLEEPVTAGAVPARPARADEALHARMVSSRAAEHLFWLGRYAERSEQAARLVRATLSRVPDARDFAPAFWPAVWRVAAGQGVIARDDEEWPGSADGLLASLDQAMFDRDSPSSLATSIGHTVRVARAVRDRLSADNWRLLQGLDESLARSSRGNLLETLDLLDKTVVALVAVAGLEMAHMTRDDGWRFLSLGRHLERALAVATTIADTLASAANDDGPMLDWLLDLSDSVITYRARHRRAPDWPSVIELLVFDGSNPRALTFQLAKLEKHVAQLPDAGLGRLVRTLSRLAAARPSPSALQGELFGRSDSVELYLAECRETATEVSDALVARYFSHAYELAHVTAVI
jgi:uncharacterized circularly permuted ATP-grasp superfamily protein/uncharacterized alpha-E superfamily protein